MSARQDALMPTPQDGASLAMAYGAAGAAGLEADPMEELESQELPPRRGNGKLRAVAPHLRRVLEAVLFATDRPVTVEQLLCAVPEETPERIEGTLEEMTRAYRQEGAGFQLEQIGGGYMLRTDPEMHEYVTRFLVGKRRSRLSRAAMETLAIVAYRQPITRGEMEEIRGVDCGQVLHTLLERDLVTVRGRSQALGRPLLYGSTEEFLRYFGINSLSDLPSPEELRSLLGSDPLEDPEIREALVERGLIESPGSDGDGASSESDAAGVPELSLAPEAELAETEAVDAGVAGRRGAGAPQRSLAAD